MIIKVTQEDIDNGTRMDSQKCPLALAIRRQYPEARNVTAGIVINIDNNKYLGRGIKGPYEVPSRFYYAFDNHENPVPCEFELTEYGNAFPT